MLAALETRPNIAKRTGVIPRQSRAIPMPPPRGVEAPPVRTPRRRPVPLLIGSAAVVLVAGLVAPALWAKARRAAPVSEIEPAASHIHSVGVLVPAGTPVRGLALSPDKKLAAVTRSDGVTQLWDLAARRSVVTLPGGGARCSTVAFSADGRRLVFGASRNAVGVWDVAARAVAFTFEAGDWVLSAAISADGTRVAAGDKSGTTWVWNTATNESRAFAHGAKPRVDVVAFAPGRLTPVSGFGSLGEARAWGDDDTHFRRPGGWVHNGMCVLADGRVVTATATEVAVFDGATGGFVRGIRATPADSQFGCVAGGPGGTWLATGGSDGAIRVWDTRTGGQRASLGIRPQPLVALAVSSDGTDALIATPDGCVRHVRLSGLE